MLFVSCIDFIYFVSGHFIVFKYMSVVLESKQDASLKQYINKCFAFAYVQAFVKQLKEFLTCSRVSLGVASRLTAEESFWKKSAAKSPSPML